MKKSILFIYFLCLSIGIYAQNSDAILGKWINEKEDRVIEVYKNNDLYYGKVIWLEDSEKGKGTTMQISLKTI